MAEAADALRRRSGVTMVVGAGPGAHRGADHDVSPQRTGGTRGYGGWVRTELLDRDAELRALTRQVAAVRDGAGRVVVVDGPAGIGKTSLLAVVARGAEAAGIAVLRARGGPLEQDAPWGVARQLFEPLRATTASKLDLPMPAGPSTTTTRPAPSRTAATCRVRACSSASLSRSSERTHPP